LTYETKDGKEMTIRQLGVPIKLSETPGTLRSGPPRFGEHTDEVLAGIGYTPAEIAALHDKGVC